MTESRLWRPESKDSVSVILPYFNRAETLEMAARSVLEQTYQNLTLFMVNDGSTDDSREIAHSLCDDRVVHLDAGRNVGVCAARNLGLKAAMTRLVAFQDSDDRWLSNKLEKQVRRLRELQLQGLPISVLGCGWVFEGGGQRKEFSSGPFDRVSLFRGVAGTGTPMLLVDRMIASPEAVFDPEFPALVEKDFLLSCLANDSMLAVLSEPLAVVTRGRKDHVAAPQRAALAWERYLEKYSHDLARRGDLRSWYEFRAAREFLIARKPKLARLHVRAALMGSPFRRAFHLACGLIGGNKGFAVAQKILPLD